MNPFKFWKKLNTVIKSKEPLQKARNMVESGEITNEEISWALVTLGTIPVAMMRTLEKNNP